MQKVWAIVTLSICAQLRAAEFENSGRDPTLTKSLKERCVATLRAGMWDGTKWVKVHAGEDLARLDYLEGVYEYYKHELALHGDEPQYRVGLWRVLAQAATRESERDTWLGKIKTACLESTSADRQHAAETLGKLGYKASAGEEEALLNITDGNDPELVVLARWVLANSGRSSDIETLTSMLTHTNANVRSKAAYALRFLPRLPVNVFEKLSSAWENEAWTNRARVHMAVACFVHAPPREKAKFKSELVYCLKSKEPGERYEACAGLAKAGTSRDIALLEKLLDDPDLDVRVGAADAILRIGRRGTVHRYSGKMGIE